MGVYSRYASEWGDQIMVLKMLSFWELAGRLENAISDVIANTRKNSWEENHLTLKWLEQIVPILDGMEVQSASERRQIACEAFKLRGKIETHHGDVAVLVRIAFDDDDELKGVGFLEAKRRDWSKDNFPALKIQQLRRLYGKTRYAKVLLYDHEPIISGAPGSTVAYRPHPVYGHDGDIDVVESLRWVPCTHAAVVSMDLMFDKIRNGRRAYRFSVPLSHQLCFRYLQGLDLELDAKIIESARRVADREEASTMVLSLGIRIGPGDGPPEPLRPDEGQYERVEQDLQRRR